MNRSIVCAVALLVISGADARAQLGGLIKKAASKVVEKKADEMAAKATPEKPLDGAPLDARSLDGVLKGLNFELEQQAEAVRLKAIQEQKLAAWRQADEAGRDEADAYRKVNEKVISCVSGELAERQREHAAEMPAKMMEIVQAPDGQQKVKDLTELGQRMSEAAQKNDTAAMRRLNMQYLRMIGLDPAADSAVAFRKCGKLPAAPASYVETERRAKELRDANEDLRKVESDLNERAAAVSGMPAREYFLARERLWAWYTARKYKRGNGGVTRDEDTLFQSREADIRKVEKALR
jgi:hypothetical protein